jgi:hypothetical protein
MNAQEVRMTDLYWRAKAAAAQLDVSVDDGIGGAPPSWYARLEELGAQCEADAARWAQASCVLVGPPEEFDPDPELRFAPTREEYEEGERDAYTANSVQAKNRHERTNYNKLVRGLDRACPIDRAYYWAAKGRANELTETA